MRQVGIYARLSQDRSGEQTATSRQESDCRKLCDLKGWDVAKVYEDVDFSAYRKGVKRPAFEEMLGDLASGAIAGIVVWKLDRLCRRIADFSRTYDACEARGAPLASVVESFDTSTGMGKFAATMLIAAAELESSNISVRVKRAQEERRAQGKWTGGGSRAFGLTKDRTSVVASEAELLTSAAARCINGESLRSIAREWNAQGVTTTKGNPWTPAGLRKTLGGSFVDLAIGPDLGERLRATLRDPTRRTVDASAEVGLLTGLLTCGLCDQTMNRKRHTARGYVSHRYVCVPEKGCGKVTVMADPVETLVTEAVFAAIDAGALTQATEAQESHPDILGDLRSDEQALEDLAYARFVERSLTPDAYRKARLALEARITSLRSTLAGAQRQRVLGDALGDLRRRWDAEDRTWRRSLLSIFVESVSVGPGARGPKFNPGRVRILWRA